MMVQSQRDVISKSTGRQAFANTCSPITYRSSMLEQGNGPTPHCQEGARKGMAKVVVRDKGTTESVACLLLGVPGSTSITVSNTRHGASALDALLLAGLVVSISIVVPVCQSIIQLCTDALALPYMHLQYPQSQQQKCNNGYWNTRHISSCTPALNTCQPTHKFSEPRQQ